MIPSKSWASLFILTLAALMASACGTTHKTIPQNEPTPKKQPPPPPPVEENAAPPPKILDPRQIPETPREMRAVWIATVANIDWPSEPGLPVAQQKAELRAMMDRARQLNMNAVMLQVRPAADAFYDSPYEPWSEFLTGRQGRPPQPYYDPLRFAIREAHRRGLELHAWFNPFRAYHNAAKHGFADKHIKNRNPRLVKKYGRYYWLDPGLKAARQYSINVILDVARRYDIDGVHLDDYFYPYAEVNSAGAKIPFPDAASYRAYLKSHPAISKADWRRQNIDQFVETLHNELRKVNPHLRFGISPFGIWRPHHPAQIKGFDAYANIYADARKWLQMGWVDYLSPQLYWPIDKPAQSFPVLLHWWQQQNLHQRHIWPGLYTNRIGNGWEASQIIRQIERTRQQKGVTGSIQFSMHTLMENTQNIDARLLSQVYNRAALVPESYWLGSQRPPQPQASLRKIDDHLVIKLSTTPAPWLWVLKVKYGDYWRIYILPGWKRSKVLPAVTEIGRFGGAALSAVNRLSSESAPKLLLPVLEHVEHVEHVEHAQ